MNFYDKYSYDERYDSEDENFKKNSQEENNPSFTYEDEEEEDFPTDYNYGGAGGQRGQNARSSQAGQKKNPKPTEEKKGNAPGGLTEKKADYPSVETRNSVEKPKILLMGLRRSGKSSIFQVVFQKMSPHETLFLESTSKIMKWDISNNSFFNFQICDFPGQLDLFSPSSMVDLNEIMGPSTSSNPGALIFVIDTQDAFTMEEAIQRLIQTITTVNPKIQCHVFFHKIDGLSEDVVQETQANIMKKVSSELSALSQAGYNPAAPGDAKKSVRTYTPPKYHPTSIYDHSIFKAFSDVVQSCLIPELPVLEDLLDRFKVSSGVERAFLFDVLSKICIASDTSLPFEKAKFELCSEMIDVVLDFSFIYGTQLQTIQQQDKSQDPNQKKSLADDPNSKKIDGQSQLPPDATAAGGMDPMNAQGAASGAPGVALYSYDDKSGSTIQLSNGSVLYLREVSPFLALVCFVNKQVSKKIGILHYNFECFKKAIADVFQVEKQTSS